MLDFGVQILVMLINVDDETHAFSSFFFSFQIGILAIHKFGHSIASVVLDEN
jgi:hypothetical protein